MFPYVASNQLDLFDTDPPSGHRSDAGTGGGIFVGMDCFRLLLGVPAGSTL